METLLPEPEREGSIEKKIEKCTARNRAQGQYRKENEEMYCPKPSAMAV